MKKKDFPDTLGDTTQSVAAKGRDALYQAGDLLNELGHYLAPRANALGKKGRAFAERNINPRLDDARHLVQPYVDDAYHFIAPRVDDVRARVEHDVLPRFNEAIHTAVDHPAAQEANKRLSAAAAALSGDLYLPEPKAKKRGPVKTIFTILLAGGLLAAVVFAIKKFLEPDDSGWQAHEPSAAYTPRPADVTPPEPAAEAAAATGDPIVSQFDEAGLGVDAAEVEEPVAAEMPQTDLGADAAEDAVAEDDADPFVVSPYGEGSYTGNEPPEGFVIKGNERSMKYHVQGTGGYERTIPDVWFDSEEAAQAAGFTRAQR